MSHIPISAANLVPFTPSDPQTTTREAFTNNILAVSIPENAHPQWADAVRHQQGLYRALYQHSAMDPNRQQTFSTPANSKSAIYHTWDTVGRTLQFLYMTDRTLEFSARRGTDKQIFNDVMGRVSLSKFLINDTSGKADMLVNSNVDVRVPFDDAIKQAAGPV